MELLYLLLIRLLYLSDFSSNTISLSTCDSRWLFNFSLLFTWIRTYMVAFLPLSVNKTYSPSLPAPIAITWNGLQLPHGFLRWPYLSSTVLHPWGDPLVGQLGRVDCTAWYSPQCNFCLSESPSLRSSRSSPYSNLWERSRFPKISERVEASVLQ